MFSKMTMGPFVALHVLRLPSESMKGGFCIGGSDVGSTGSIEGEIGYDFLPFPDIFKDEFN